jgi:hypothetical protein
MAAIMRCVRLLFVSLLLHLSVLLLRRGFCVLAGRPDAASPGGAPDYLLHGACPASKVRAMLDDAARLIEEMAGPEPMPKPSAAQPAAVAQPPAEEVAAQEEASGSAVSAAA